MGSEELKPCPFCGSSLIDPKGWASLDQSGPACDMCGATAENTEVWNKRALDPSGVVAEIAAERKRQVEDEGWTPEHDDEHESGEMARAAAAYALAASYPDFFRMKNSAVDKLREEYSGGKFTPLRELWPWDWAWWKPKNRRRDLIRAAALIVAEVERLKRLAANSNSEGA